MNKFGGYKYRSCEDILEALKPLLKQNGLVLTLTDEIYFVSGGQAQAVTVKEYSDKAKGTIERTQIIGGDRFYVKATATLGDGENDVIVNAYAREEQDKRGMDGSQITGAASSYARKYALNGLFCIDDTKDADATNKHDNDEAPIKPAKTPIDKPASKYQLENIAVLCKELKAEVKTEGLTYQQATVLTNQLIGKKRELDRQLDSIASKS